METLSEEQKEALLKGYTTHVLELAEEADLREKQARADKVARENEERRKKETVIPPKELSPWEKDSLLLETEGLDTRNPETVVMGGEKRTDEEVGK